MYLEDLLHAMTRIGEYIEGYSFVEFKRDYKTVDAVIRNFEIIGEASKNLPEEIKKEISRSAVVRNVFAKKQNFA